MQHMKKKSNRFFRIIKILLIVSGSIFITLLVLAFTKIPYWAYDSLGTGNSRITKPPVTIILLSGSGIPSESGLLRAYFTAKIGEIYPHANIVISMPGILNDSLSDPRLTADELVMRGIARERIGYECNGKNTRQQAMKLAEGKTKVQLDQPVTLITSPEHMKRSVLVFRKCGFTTVSGCATFGSSIQTDMTFEDNDLKGNKYIPSIGNNLQVRYQFWTQLKLEILVLREYFGLAYYKLRGWV
jgi:uncharacterized SAM-binding protein YcdF (DUF218 family)